MSSVATVDGTDLEDLVFKALADRRRRAMLDLLKTRPRTTGELCDALLPLDRCTVMQHLAVLERAGLVVSKREGRTRMNYLDALPVLAIQRRWLGGLVGSALEGLEQLASL